MNKSGLDALKKRIAHARAANEYSGRFGAISPVEKLASENPYDADLLRLLAEVYYEAYLYARMKKESSRGFSGVFSAVFWWLQEGWYSSYAKDTLKQFKDYCCAEYREASVFDREFIARGLLVSGKYREALGEYQRLMGTFVVAPREVEPFVF